MTRSARAAVCRDWNAPVTTETIQVEGPRRNEVTLRLHACGVCHSDLSAATGVIPFPPPLVLGHEGAGEIIEVGEGVAGFGVGDRVITSFVSMCGTCRYCNAGRPVLCETVNSALTTLPDGTVRTRDADGEPLNIFSGCGVMAEVATVHVNNIVPLTDAVPMECAALTGCAVMTGVGAVFNTAALEPGSIAVVFGAGGVGLNVIQGCRIAGARRIIAVDTSEEKLETARRFGATDVVVAGDDTPRSIRKLTRGGADYAFECVGRGAVAEQAYATLGKGGTAIVVGVAPREDMTHIRTLSLPAEERGIRGSWFGSARPRHDLPRLFGLYAKGDLLLDELISERYGIDQAGQAFADLASGRNARGVITFDAPAEAR